jgi:pyruvate formate lyase activating enzyme
MPECAEKPPLSPEYVRGRWQHALPDGRIQCDLCPRYCRLHEGQRAFCFVRQRVGDAIYLTSYGKATGFCIDPIEKKPLYHYLPGSSILSFGTAGCNLGCKFCQNWDISKARSVERLSDTASPDRIAEAAVAAGCKSVAFTYNDPVIFAEFAMDTARACRERGLAAVAVTAGYIAPQARRDFYAEMDAANVDLKAFSEQFYRKLCFAELGPVLETLRYLKHETNVWFEVTTLLIPGQNDAEEEIDRLCDWFAENLGTDVPLHFTAFHPDFKLTDIPHTPAETCRRARAQAKRHGIRHVYSGNIHDSAGQSTYCANCGKRVIERDWYALGEYRLSAARCAHCQTVLPGRFTAQKSAQNWGRRRLRVALD